MKREISYHDLLRILRKRIWFILLIPCLVSTVAWLDAHFRTGYEAETWVYFENYPIMVEGEPALRRAHALLSASPGLERLYRMRTETKAPSDENDVPVNAELTRGPGGQALHVSVWADTPEAALAMINAWIASYREYSRGYHMAQIIADLKEDITSLHRERTLHRAVLDASREWMAADGVTRHATIEPLETEISIIEAKIRFSEKVYALFTDTLEEDARGKDSVLSYRDTLISEADARLVVTPAQLVEHDDRILPKLLAHFLLTLFLTGGVALFIETGRRHSPRTDVVD